MMSKITNAKIDYVYFLQAGQNGYIKIGHSKNPQARLKNTQVGNPLQIVLLCIMEGGLNLERELLQKFWRSRMSGEWFELTKELNELISKQKYLGLTINFYRMKNPLMKNNILYLPPTKSKQWKTGDVSHSLRRNRSNRIIKETRKKYPNCQQCKIRKTVSVHYVNGNIEDLNEQNLLYLCMRCKMYIDGRVDKLIKNTQKELTENCINCNQLYPITSRKMCRGCYDYWRKYKQNKPIKIMENI